MIPQPFSDRDLIHSTHPDDYGHGAEVRAAQCHQGSAGSQLQQADVGRDIQLSPASGQQQSE